LFEYPVAFDGMDDEKIAKFRQMSDQIEARVKTWIAVTQ
jgi:hypothetical protein